MGNKQLSSRKEAIRELSDRLATYRDSWITKNKYYYECDLRYMKFLVPEGLRVLELGCGTGWLLNSLKPSLGIGVDLSREMVAEAKKKYPSLEFRVGDIEDPSTILELKGPFDAIVLSDTIGTLEDCENTFLTLQSLCTRDTRIIITYYNRLWGSIGLIGEKLGLKMTQTSQNWLSMEDIVGLLNLADFELIKKEWRQIIPKYLFGLGPLVNRTVATLPVIRRACIRIYLVFRSRRGLKLGKVSTTVLIPCRNERGNIEAAVRRIPNFCEHLEILFVEGHSKDGTCEEVQRVIKAFPEKDIKIIQQDGKGKGDAVKMGFAHAGGEIVIILDADLTVPPEDLPKFYRSLVDGKGDFANGSRLIYPMEKKAMRVLNFLANRGFARVFSWLLNERITDTLCGTKALTKAHYQKIAAGRSYFGDFDPFGDFDLLFGAAKANLKIIEIPIRYAAREYGETQISRFQHGWLLCRMIVFAYWKLKAF